MSRTLCIALFASMIGALAPTADVSAHPRPHAIRCWRHCVHGHFWRPGYYGHKHGH